MTRALRTSLTLLVLLNLVFVQLTNAVGVHWLVPMQVLAALSPLMVRFQERLWWRTAWNLGVIAIFGILVRDTTTSGPRHLLEDGLILAAFCQVHLLNVLRRQQKPDLLFFNSFLIALVTSFFCQDVAFSVTFAGYAFVFVAGLELAADRGRRPAAHVVRGSLPRSVAVTAITALAFALLPRDFRREGLVSDDALSSFVAGSSSGFADEIHLDRSVHTTLSDRVVMRITPVDGDASRMPALWRGAALEWYDARGWRSVTRPRNDAPTSLPWTTSARGTWRRDGEPALRVRVECDDADARALFAPLGATEVGVPADAFPDAVYPRADGTFARRRPRDLRPEPWSYSVALGADARTVGTAEGRALRPFLHVAADDAQAVPPVVHGLLVDALRDVAPDASQSEVVERCRALLETRFDYLLPGQQGSARDLGAFLAGDGGGHCELFATGLALMLRLRGIPCRVATGYLVDEWDATQRQWIVRQRHAHAWVEVYDGSRQVWEGVDATPPASTATAEATGWLDTLLAPVRDAWRAVTTFDGDARRALLDRLAGMPAALVASAGRRPLATAGLLALLAAAAVALGRVRRRWRDDPIRAYRRALRHLRITRDPHETPRELLERVRATPGLRPEHVTALERATDDHETARFASATRPVTPASPASVPTC